MRTLIFAGCSLLLALTAYAGTVPTGLIVDRGGLEWVWASPCAPEQPSCGNSIVDSSGDAYLGEGWRLADDAEWLSSFTDSVDVYNAFDAGALCASAYFGSGFSHCDAGDAYAGYIWGAPSPIGNSDADNLASESFLVRSGSGVPEPATWGLLGLGLAALGTRLRRRS
jgi:PEP-CTERM motif